MEVEGAGVSGNKRKKKSSLEISDVYSEVKDREMGKEFNVFITLVQEGGTFDVWSPIQLSKAIHKEG